MSDLRKAAKQALEALEYALPALESAWYNTSESFKVQDAIIALRDVLAEPSNIGCLGMPVNVPVTRPKAEQEPDEVKQIAEALRQAGLTLIRTGTGFRVADLGRVEAQTAPQPKAEQEPVCEVGSFNAHVIWLQAVPPTGTKLYTAPQPRKRLSDEELSHIIDFHLEGGDLFDVARAIEAAVLGEKT